MKHEMKEVPARVASIQHLSPNLRQAFRVPHAAAVEEHFIVRPSERYLDEAVEHTRSTRCVLRWENVVQIPEAIQKVVVAQVGVDRVLPQDDIVTGIDKRTRDERVRCVQIVTEIWTPKAGDRNVGLAKHRVTFVQNRVLLRSRCPGHVRMEVAVRGELVPQHLKAFDERDALLEEPRFAVLS